MKAISKNRLRDPVAALRGTRFPARLSGLSGSRMTGREGVWRRLSRRSALFAVLACAALLSARAVRPPHAGLEGQAAWQRHLAWVRAHPDWRLRGRFALTVGHKGLSGGLHWRERGDHYRMEVFGPLGRTQAVLEGGPASVTLQLAGKPPRRAPSAQALMREALGWSLPVAGLRYWVRGIPAPGAPPAQLRFDAEGRLVFLHQDGWRIRYLAYDYAYGPQALPTRLELRNGRVRIVLLVDRWGAGG